MVDFLGEEELCGPTLLRLVSRGSAIIAELLRLSENIPAVLFPDCASDKEYQEVLWDFGYLRREDEVELQVRSAQRLLDLDDEFRATHGSLMGRFYSLFEAVYRYATDYGRFLQEVEDGVYIQQTFDTIFANSDGKQLMCEALYLYGVMLLLLDQRIEGVVRERILVHHLRTNAKDKYSANFDAVCALCRQTGYSARYGKAPGTHPAGYPEDYFARLPIPSPVVRMVLGRLRSDDVYQMALHYPLPEHRSTALATQAALLYVSLYFDPSLLKTETAAMREVVDRHFPDNWVVGWYLGFTADLSVAWAPYRAAARALDTVLQGDGVRRQVVHHARKLETLNAELRELLQEGVLTEDYVLDNVNSKLLPVVRDSNATLRWLMLHRTATNRKVRDTTVRATAPEEVLRLMLSTAHLEFVLREMFQMLLKCKGDRWAKAQDVAVRKLTTIADYFGGDQPLAAERREEQLQEYFAHTADLVAELNSHDAGTLAGRKITHLIAALEEVEQFHQVDANLQVRQFLIDTRGLLRRMLRYVNIQEAVLVTLSTAGDMSYAWEVVRDYVPIMQIRIKKQPACVLTLRTVFLKLASLLELPLTRIAQCGSADLASVSQYYSEKLVTFVSLVLDIIPSSMFEVLHAIMGIQITAFKECPTKVPRSALPEYAQPDVRYDLAKLAYQVSNYTMGILAMRRTLVGVIRVDPHRLLEEGVRKELVAHVAATLHEALQFPARRDKVPLPQRLADLSRRLTSMRSGLEYIQDYIRMNGLRLWQEEFTRIVQYNVEQECGPFLRKRPLDWDSPFQSAAAPIPKFTPSDDVSLNFMGRLVRELQAATDGRRTTYMDALGTWYDDRDREALGPRTISLVRESVGVPGLLGVDQLLAVMTAKELQTSLRYVDRVLLGGLRTEVDALAQELETAAEDDPRPGKRWYDGPLMAKLTRAFFPTLLDGALRIGRNQLLRRHVAAELTFACRLDSQALGCALATLSEAAVAEVRAHFLHPDHNEDSAAPPYPAALLAELAPYLDNVGMGQPLMKVYTATEPMGTLSVVVALLAISCCGRLTDDPALGGLVRRRKDDPIDGVPLACGLATVLRQSHGTHLPRCLGLLARYARALLTDPATAPADRKAPSPPPPEAVVCAHFMDAMARAAALPAEALDGLLPPALLSLLVPRPVDPPPRR